MVRRRRIEFAYLLGSLLLLAASLHPSTAYSAPGDPPSGSPAGAVYELPFEQGRADAAPKGSGGTSAGGGSDAPAAAGDGGAGSSGSEAGSLYRTENNFGSSSQVPGLAATGSGPGGGGAGGAAAGTGGGGGAGAASGAIAGGEAAAEAADMGNTSVAAGALLLAAIGLLAAAAGVLSRRFSQR